MSPSDLINALSVVRKLPTKITLSIALICAILLFLNHQGALDAVSERSVISTWLTIIFVVSAVLAIVSVAAFFLAPFTEARKQTLLERRRKIRKREAEANREELEKSIIAELDYLSPEENSFLHEFLERESRTIFTYVGRPEAATLLDKQIISTPGGRLNSDHYPFSIETFVWIELLKRKEQLEDAIDGEKMETHYSSPRT